MPTRNRRLHPRHKTLLCCLCLIMTTASCKKNIQGVTPPDAGNATTMSQVFEDYWNGMNNNYVFWDIDTTNWDRVHGAYKPRFALLDINKRDCVLSACRYFREMTAGLTDSHYNLSFYNSFLADSSINPAGDRKKSIRAKSLAAVPGFFGTTIRTGYLDKDSSVYIKSTFSETAAGKTVQSTLEMLTGTIDQHKVYFRVNEFFVKQRVDADTAVAAVWHKFLHYLQQPGITGLIVDMRSNNGGDLEDLDLLCGQLISAPLPFAYTKEKSGNGRLDYTPWAKAVVTPETGAVLLHVPIVVLTDQNSISMAEMTTMALKQLPNGKTHILGDTTWGANGPLTTSIGLLGGGQFNFGGFGYVYTSSAQYKYIDDKIYEHKGFPPDEYMPVDIVSAKAGRDVQLERAKVYIDTHQ